jgi:UDP-N-acetylmuramoylalanine-D-glutamate ligase
MNISDEQLFQLLTDLAEKLDNTSTAVATLSQAQKLHEELAKQDKIELNLKLKPVFDVCEKFKDYESRGKGILLTISILSGILGYVAAKLHWF